MKKKKSGWLFKVNPWVCEFLLLCCAVVGLVAILGCIKTTVVQPVQYNQLQQVDGKMKDFQLSYNGYCKITLEDRRVYFTRNELIKDFAPERLYPLLSDRYVGASVTLWVDKDFKFTRSFPTEVYAIEVGGETYLSYEEACDYLSALRMTRMSGYLKAAFVSFVLTAIIGTLLFLLANKGWEAERRNKSQAE